MSGGDWAAARTRVRLAQLVAISFVISIIGMVYLLSPLATEPQITQSIIGVDRITLVIALVAAMMLSHFLPKILLKSQLKRLSGKQDRLERVSALYLSASVIGNALREGVGMIGIVFALLSQEPNLVSAFGVVAITLICVNWPSEEGLRRLESANSKHNL